MDISTEILLCGIICGFGFFYMMGKDIYNDMYPSIAYLKEKQQRRLNDEKYYTKWLKNINDSFEYEQLKKEKQIQWEKDCIEANTILPFEKY